MKATLVPIEGKGKSIALTRNINIVGRNPECDIVIDHDSLSRRHAVLVLTDGLVVVRDLITTNGTRVNSQRIKWAALMPNDRISFGSVRFRIELGPDSDFPRSEPLESIDQSTPSMQQILGLPDSPIPGPLLNVMKQLKDESSEWEINDDSQNTEVGGWRPNGPQKN